MTARVPPQNLDAERAMLGAMLLSRDAVAAATEIIPDAGDLYRPAHGHIYEAILILTVKGVEVDPITVAEELKRHGFLDKVGGTAALVELQADAPSTSNAGHYARIVHDHAVLRHLIRVASTIQDNAYGSPADIRALVDEAETAVFNIAEHGASSTTARLSDLISGTLDRLELLHERGDDITGLATGFYDLDQLTAGLQPGNLVVIGARPSMGKTSLALGMASHAAFHAERPTLFFSLEMSRLELTQRILGSEARVDSKKLRTGRLDDRDWSAISNTIGKLGERPLWIDDNAQVTVMEIRSKARRLRAEVGDLGLVVVDYVQLMTGRSNAESRQVEVAEISRGLKLLARELECPVVALAQLNRGLESRSDKRPMLSDLRESGCLTASTRLLRADTGAEVTLGELVESGERDVPVWSLDDRWRLVPATLTHAFPSGTKPIYRMTLASGRTVEATANHQFRTVEGWLPLGTLAAGDRIAAPRRVPAPTNTVDMEEDLLVLLAHLLGDGCVLPGRAVQYTSADEGCMQAVEVAAARRFGIKPRRAPDKGSYQVFLPSPVHNTHDVRHPLTLWWDSLGLRGCRSHQKFVPACVFNTSNDQVATFLRHLWSTDGTISVSEKPSKVTISYSTTSPQLACDVQRLLERCDLQARIKKVEQGIHRPAYLVTVDGADEQRRFLENIGIHGTSRLDRIEKAQKALADVVANTNVDTIPWQVKPRITTAMARAGITQRQLADALEEQYCGSYLLGSPARPRSSRRSRLERIAEIVGDDELRDLATSDVLWDRVVAVEPVGDQPVFDATVLGTHNFVANGIVAHNSIEQDSDIVMFVYRDEVYEPTPENAGLAEVIIAKHRNGPTGVVRLSFLAHLTRFESLPQDAKGF